MSDDILRVAVQKSGRLADKSMEILAAAGLRFGRGRDELLMRAKNLPVELLRIRDDDIPGFVATGACDLGVVGRNVFDEYVCDDGNDAEPLLREALGFSRCSLKIAAPRGFDYRGPADLEGLRIATSYPSLTRRFLNRNTVRARIIAMSGAVEIAPRLDIADAICDIVATGATLEANGLRAVETVLESEALMIETPRRLAGSKRDTADRLMLRIRGVLASAGTKYIMMNAPAAALDDVTRLLPGAGAPTVTPLAGRDDVVAVHAVCGETVFWETLEKLKDVGASAILVVPIEKMMA